MARYFYDTEFLEGTQKSFFGQSKPTIDLISIGIVAEDGREYYAISKDFNLKEAWNRYDKVVNRHFPLGPEYNKLYWIRENVLRPIYSELLLWEYADKLHVKINSSEFLRLKEMREQGEITIKYPHFDKCYKDFKRLLNKYGKTNNQIAKELKHFIYEKEDVLYNKQEIDFDSVGDVKSKIQFYGYYSAYDHVALCWLFGKMIDLPKGFPMYTIDLKQSFDNKAESLTTKQLTDFQYGEGFMNHDVYAPLNYMKVDYTKADLLKRHKNYPKQTNEHNALSDAKWNYELYKFLQTL